MKILQAITQYKDLLQTLCYLFSALLALPTLYLLLKASRAADRQAIAADAQSRAADQATDIAKQQVSVSKQERLDSLVPYVICVPEGDGEKTSFWLENQGIGVAQNIRFWIRNPDRQAVVSSLDTLGPGYKTRLHLLGPQTLEFEIYFESVEQRQWDIYGKIQGETVVQQVGSYSSWGQSD